MSMVSRNFGIVPYDAVITDTAREKKLQPSLSRQRPASSHLVGFQKGYGVALAQQCGLQLYFVPTCYRNTGQACVPLYRGLAGVEGRWYLIYCPFL